jgi:hypothetical protein
MEVFTVTAWGEVPRFDRLVAEFPGLAPEASHLVPLRERLTRWQGCG